MRAIPRYTVWLLLSAGLTAPAADAAGEAQPQDPETIAFVRDAIHSMQDNARGPFTRIRWFCTDGTVLPPKAYACRPHGGGVQHGEWSDQTRRVRAAGYPIANVLASLGPEDFGETPQQQQHFRFLLLEQFLIAADDGWIIRKARFYRGAFQAENEEASATEILQSMAGNRLWRINRYPLLFEAVRLLPHGDPSPTVSEVRGMAAVLSEKDSGFRDLRAKIHGNPDLGDATRVREYAERQGQGNDKPELMAEFEALARAIVEGYQRPDAAAVVLGLAQKLGSKPLATDLSRGAEQLGSAADASGRLAAGAGLLALIRSRIDDIGNEVLTLEALDVAVALEQQVFTDAVGLSNDAQNYSRENLFDWMRSISNALYGTGLITAYERSQLQSVFDGIPDGRMAATEYRDLLDYLGRVPVWSARRLMFFFESAIHKLAPVEPKADHYIADRLRGSPLLGYSRIQEVLNADLASIANMRHEVFGQSVVTGLRALNPGLAKGTLRDIENLQSLGSVTPDSIVIVPETVAELPAVAGILTAHEGNNLSHVQLLARNLGIPNVVVQDSLLAIVKQKNGTQVVVAASPGGVVQIDKDNGQLDPYLVKTTEEIERSTIRVDINKLNLEQIDFIGTDRLRGTDSGVLVGPKAAQVGELTHHFPNAVSPALAVPFGAFRQNLARPVKPGGIPMFEHMTLEYDRLADIGDPDEKRRETGEFLEFVRNWITSSELPSSFRSRLRKAMENQFGADGSYGVFVRSDTNVEDLAGFTGAGLNLTIPNVVGFDNVVEAIKEVWASPFTERAFGWRQGLMATPEHVYTSVLLHKTIANEKSGVMVTADVETGERGYLSVVVNEGVGGGVEGFSAETLRIDVQTGEVRLLGSATASTRREVLPQGGSHLVPASGADHILTDQEIRQLVRLTDSMPGWFINLPPEERAAVIADIEFGFLGGRMTLQQIRPYVENESAENNAYLRGLDAGLAHLDQVVVMLGERPRKETL